MFENDVTAEILRWVVLLSATGIASVFDLRERRIPNWLTFPLAFSGLVAATMVGGWGWDGFLDSLAAFFALSFPCLVVYARGGGGAGDVKLMMGVGAWCGLDLGMYVLITVSVTGLIWSLVLAATRGQLKALIYGMSLEIWLLVRGRRTVPATATSGGSEESLATQPPAPAVKGTELAYGPVIMLGTILGGVAWFIL